MGPKLMICCKPKQMGILLNKIHVLEDGSSRQRRQEAGGLKDKGEELREKSIRGFKQVRNDRFHGPKKDYGISSQKSAAG